MKLAFLVTLDAILKTGSFAGAAQEVGLTPSAVSLQVKRLEEYLGRPLFDRSGRKARPTPLARELAESVAAALQAVDDARVRSTVTVSGRVVIGAIRTLQHTIIPMVLREIAERYPELSVKVIQGDSIELLNQLKAGELDGAAVIRPSSGGSSRLAWANLAEQPFVFVAPRGTPEMSPETLIETYGWLQFDTSLTGGRIAAAMLHRLAPGTRPRFELESIEAVLAMVSEGQGVSILPRLGGETAGPHAVRLITLGDATPARTVAFVCRGADADNRRVGAIRNAFVASYESLTD